MFSKTAEIKLEGFKMVDVPTDAQLNKKKRKDNKRGNAVSPYWID